MYAGKLTYRLPLHECISHIYPCCWFVFHPFVDDWQKRGEWFWVYICAYLEIEFMHILSLCILCLYKKKGRRILKVYTKRGRRFLEKRLFGLCMFSFTLFIHIYLFSFMHFIEYLLVYCYAWVKGELLWSLTLIHAYITPWVLSSSKRGRLLAQRPYTLVLMMINSCSYVY